MIESHCAEKSKLKDDSIHVLLPGKHVETPAKNQDEYYGLEYYGLASMLDFGGGISVEMYIWNNFVKSNIIPKI